MHMQQPEKVNGQHYESYFLGSSICYNCEHFHCFKEPHSGRPISYQGRCGLDASPYVETNADNGCNQFTPDSTRWPRAEA